MRFGVKGSPVIVLLPLLGVSFGRKWLNRNKAAPYYSIYVQGPFGAEQNLPPGNMMEITCSL